MKKTILYLLFILKAAGMYPQSIAINQLDEVVLSDVKLHKNSKGQQVQVLNDSTLENNRPLLSSLLKFNSPIYFKENGHGMVSSASFRGGTASQTAVVWNGININSQFNGQTDFNSLNTGNYDNVAVRGGGGSVLYGSGAIGGSVHLNNRLKFNKGLNNRLKFEYGSFNTFSGLYRTEYSSQETSLQFSAVRNSSDNDYKFLGTDKRNENGDFKHTAFSAAGAHLLDESNTLKFYLNFFEGDRGFSGTLAAASRSKYENRNSRNMLVWKRYFNKFTSDLKAAYLLENYHYFENRHSDDYDFGKASTGIIKYDLSYRLHPSMSLNAVIDYEHTYGEGTNVGSHRRNIGALALLFNHDLGKFGYEVSGRKEITDRYESPFLYSLSAGYAVTPNYEVKLNISKNFRIPTYNDLFWRAGGDMDLLPEESLQAEIGQEINYKNLHFGLTAYVIKIDNLLRWVPDSGGLWRPENTRSVQNHGLEALGSWQKNVGEHSFTANATYAYTRTKDEKTNKSLIYVPEHKTTVSAGYGFKKISAYYQFLYNDSLFTSSDNNYELEGYTLSNLGFNYSFMASNKGVIGLEIQNLWNTSYQSLPSRPMPGRSINTSLTFNF